MNYIETKYWIKGYVDALQKCENVSKEHLQDLIAKVQNVIDDIETNRPSTEQFGSDEYDDLPF